jgi:phosphohistidine phosphatase
MKAGFFRHGPAVPRGTPGMADDDRPLTPEGRKKTTQAARGVRRLDLGFDAIYTSRLPRAVQTAEILAKILRLPKPKVLDALLPGAAAQAVVKAVRALRKDAPLLVGHEPSLSSAVCRAVGAGTEDLLQLKKAGLAVVDMDPGASSRGTLRMLLAPSVLRRLGRR